MNGLCNCYPAASGAAQFLRAKINNLKINPTGCSVATKGKSMNKKLLTVLCVCLMSLGGVNTSRASDDNAVAAIADVTIVRPGCFLATVIGSAFFVIALPFAAASGSVKATANTLVVQPAQATFTRPVGDFTSLQ